MSRSTRLAMALAVCAITGVFAGVGGHIAQTSDRSVTVNIAETNKAYISINETLTCQENKILINRFPGEVTATVGITPIDGKLRIGPGSGTTEVVSKDSLKRFHNSKLHPEDAITVQVESQNTTASKVKINASVDGSTVAAVTEVKGDVTCN